jgi:hypothetical protein
MAEPKNITIGSRHFQIRKMTPLIASRIHSWFVYIAVKIAQESMRQSSSAEMTAAIESAEKETPENPQELAEARVKFIWFQAPGALSEEACEKIQQHALNVCTYLTAESIGAYAPLTMANGKWADASLEDDAVTVSDLITEALIYSIAPFFLKGLPKTSDAIPTK